MAIKLEMLRCFSVVAQTGSLAEAARQLGRTPSAISMTLKQLEAHLGERLFESDRKNRLTPLGTYVFEQSRTELRQFDNTIRAIETFAGTPRGLIRVGSVPSMVGMIFPQALTEFREIYPEVAIDIRDMDAAGVMDALTRGQIDIGIATANGRIGNSTQRLLYTDNFGLVCSRHHPLALQPEAPMLADLANFSYVRNTLSDTISDPAVKALPADNKVSTQSTLSLLTLLRSVPWVSVLPRAVVQIDPHRLAFRKIQDLDAQRPLHLLVRTLDGTHPYFDDFIEIVARTANA